MTNLAQHKPSPTTAKTSATAAASTMNS
ncbi:unnamed protein product, partial [Rotaria socialis]